MQLTWRKEKPDDDRKQIPLDLNLTGNNRRDCELCIYVHFIALVVRLATSYCSIHSETCERTSGWLGYFTRPA